MKHYSAEELFFKFVFPTFFISFSIALFVGRHYGELDGINYQQDMDCQVIATKNLDCGPGESGYKRNNVCFCTTRNNKTITFARELKFNE